LAAGRGLVVGLDGQVAVPPDPGVAGPERDGLLAAAEAAQAMARQALAAAEEVDADAAAATASVGTVPGGSRGGLLGGLRGGLLGGLLGRLLAGMLVSAVSRRGLPPAGLPPAEVAAWWDSLAPAERGALEQAWPERVGRLDGLPVDVRDRANRGVLQRAVLDVLDGFSFDDLKALEVLRAVDRALARPDARLLDLEPGVPGRAAIALGDLEGADHVAVLVPGLGADVAPGLGGLVSSAAALRDRASAKRAGSVATVAWIGYDAPGLLSVTSDARAQQGSPPLRAVLRGIDARAAAGGRDPHLTLSGHSYGSLVAGYAVRERTGVDDLVVLGSPGVGVGRADELWVRRGHVFAAEAKWDGVADLSRFGGDPDGEDFGGRVVQTDGRKDPMQERLYGISWHTHYYDRQTESLDNLALVTVGQLDRVSYR
jgi:hypothetical protein